MNRSGRDKSCPYHVKGLTESSIERILEPLHIAPLHIVQQYGIEAAWRGARETGEILLRGTDDGVLITWSGNTCEVGAAGASGSWARPCANTAGIAMCWKL